MKNKQTKILQQNSLWLIYSNYEEEKIVLGAETVQSTSREKKGGKPSSLANFASTQPNKKQKNKKGMAFITTHWNNYE